MPPSRPSSSASPPSRLAPLAVGMLALGLFGVDAAVLGQHAAGPRDFALRFLPVLLLTAAAAALVLAVRRIRLRCEFTDAFFPLVLLNPLFVAAAAPLDKTLLGAGLLGLLCAAIVGMKRESLPRYLLAGGIMLALPLLSVTFLMLIPALILWLGFVGFLMARDHDRAIRPRGFVVLALAEIGLILFGIACLLEPATPTPKSTAGAMRSPSPPTRSTPTAHPARLLPRPTSPSASPSCAQHRGARPIRRVGPGL